MMRVLAVLACLSCACAGAQHAATTPRPAEDPTVLAPSEALGRPFVVQQKLHGRHGDRELSLDVVVQLADQKLTLVGLTPFGSRAFVLTQTGREMRFEKLVDREMPFDPAYVLRDVHRVFFRGLKGPLPDGEHVGELDGERITERWAHGFLVERRFERLDLKPAGVIVVRYGGPPAPVIASHVRLENGWFGYTIELENVAQQWLSGGSSP